ncbi:heme peroxidase [Pseudomonas cavernicola]|uniref:Heme peroxidase n=1 Tax=Pseudomonas cavernicola TaxID=2320866 RepID=A0A418X9P9_9PSED|nr:peroxidase family protein [Pseudomonas cavernicola]RJG09214.1 heme peroxidase [Pseudomonas cavernicola]
MATLTINKADLQYILKQIEIAEAHSSYLSSNPNASLAEQAAYLRTFVESPLLPEGLRTVDGSLNSLVPGQELFGSADQLMTRLLNPVFNSAENALFDPDGSGPLVAGSLTSYAQTSGFVFDSQPRTISNLIADQTATNPAAVAAAGTNQTTDPEGTLLIPNVSADEGLTAPFNSWMTLFGQFFDHGLDLVSKGGSGTVFIPLLPGDPLYVEGSQTNFMVMTRATNQPGPDGQLGTADDVHEHTNTTTPFIDQNQTYTSNGSHQTFLREYALNAEGKPVATGHMLDGQNGGLATWADIKAQAAQVLGIQLADFDVTNVPMLAVDPYGEFIRGDNGYPQLYVRVPVSVENPNGIALVEGNPAAPISTEFAIRTGHAFLDDIAHNANPFANGVMKAADTDGAVGLSESTGYDDELLNAHYITGDGRGNENIGLTAVHHVFHAEHNRLVDSNKQTILESGDLAFINEWLLVDVATVPTTPEAIAALVWDGERLFQAARVVNEMQYQHLVFEEFARTVQPAVDAFVFSHTAEIDPAIVAEFAHVVYRFGHSMLTETVDRIGMDLATGTIGVNNDIGLIQAFLNPLEFAASGVDSGAAAGAIIRGMTRQVGNEIDEFVTEALRNNLVGLPLDLVSINMARARDTGIPSLNVARAQFFEMTGDSQLKPYVSWVDFALNIKNPASIINFIAAYGQHQSILDADTLAAKRAAATLLVTGGIGEPADRVAFLNSTGTWTAANSGLNSVDFWIGGLAEEKMPFGGMLGSTFNFVFEAQLENLQSGDRYYYLSRLQGTNLLNELEGNSFSALVMRNTDLGNPNSSHLPGQLFAAVDHILEIETSRQIGVDPIGSDPILQMLSPLVVRQDLDGDGDSDLLQYNGGGHVVLGGSAEDDVLLGGDGDDTLWGDAGNDQLDGGYGVDIIHGGEGDDIITDLGTDLGASDLIHGDGGNDVIHAGNGLDLVFGGEGSDFILAGQDGKQVFGGRDNDFVQGSDGNDFLMGNEGDDWMEGGQGFDTLAGENSELFFNSPVIGHDVLDGGGNDTDYDGESGDDIMVQGLGIQRNEGMFGFDWAIHKNDPLAANSDLNVPIFTTVQADILRDRFDQVEGLSGWQFNDVLIGDDRGGAETDPEFTLQNHELTQAGVDRIAGLNEVLGQAAAANPSNDPNAILFDGGNIILGGDGSDLIEGRGFDDIIDGDAWLNVRIVVAAGPNNEAFSVDSMSAVQTRLLSGAINPSQLSIVREILQADGSGDVDTAVYSDAFANYEVIENLDGTWTVAHTAGTLADGTDLVRNVERLQFADQTVVIGGTNQLPTGSVTISDSTPSRGQLLTATTSAVLDPDGVVGSITFVWQAETGEGGWVDVGTGPTFQPGTAQVGQVLRVVASFTDGLGAPERVSSAPTEPVILNNTPTGLPTISDTTPAQGQVLTATPGTLADADGTAGAVFSYQWQVGSGATFADIAGATSQTFTPGQLQVGQQLRVVASYTDNLGALESVTSAPTAAVANLNDAPTGSPVISDTTPNLGQALTAAPGSIADADGVTGVAYTYQWQALSAGSWANIADATAATFTPSQAQTGQQLRVVATYTDNLGTLEQVLSAATAVVSDLIIGTAGNDVLIGTAFDDNIQGLGGDDVIIGGGGADTMVGGGDNDVYEVTEFGDVVSELAGAGADTVWTSLASYTLGANVENLFFGDTGNFSGTGNALDNIIHGGIGNDTLNGGAGDDFMAGGTGHDVYEVTEFGDVVSELAGAGADTVWTSLASYTLGANVENLFFGDTGNFSGTGNALDNIIHGGIGNDTLNGGAGGDVIIGGGGADTMAGGDDSDVYEVTELGDVVSELAGGGSDTVWTSLANYTLGADVENLFFGDTGNFSGTGNELANTIVGGAGNDTLTGGGGNDFMDGGLGNDTFVFAAGFGNDAIQGFDANPVGGQDLLNIAALGVTAANFAANVTIADVGVDTLVTVGASSIVLVGIADATTVTQTDFNLAV